MPGEHFYRGRKRARQARADLGVGFDGPLPDVLDVAERLGGTHVVVLDLGEDVAGAFLGRPDLPLLFVNGRQFVPRQRFTLAHEYGHHYIGHTHHVDLQAAMWDRSHDPREVEANSFAAEFLAPEEAIQTWGKGRRRVTLEDVVRLAADYGVSCQMMRIRLETVGVIEDHKLCERLDGEIDGELHLELFQQLGLEPLRDQLSEAAAVLPRIPAPLRRSALGDLLAGEIDAAGLAARTGRSLQVVERMLASLGLDVLLATAR